MGAVCYGISKGERLAESSPHEAHQYPPCTWGLSPFSWRRGRSLQPSAFPQNMPRIIAYGVIYGTGLICGWHYRRTTSWHSG